MNDRSINLAGLRFGSLVAIERAGTAPGKAGAAIWMCRCDCGVQKTFYSNALRSGSTKSCGCMKSESVASARTTHGMTHSREFNTWKGMISRTTNPEDPFWGSYGGRGIYVCDRWKGSFENFFSDMGKRPEGTTLDRIDNDKGYEPGNCRWATKKEQALNRRTTIRLKLNGEEVSRKEAAFRIGISVNSLRRWLMLGLSADEVMNKYRKLGGVSTVEGSLC